jgi:hypothetical protein
MLVLSAILVRKDAVNLGSSDLAPSSASVAKAAAEMVRELLHRKQGGRELTPCIIAEERPANQTRLSTWTRQFRKVARRTHIADWTMNTQGFF